MRPTIILKILQNESCTKSLCDACSLEGWIVPFLHEDFYFARSRLMNKYCLGLGVYTRVKVDGTATMYWLIQALYGPTFWGRRSSMYPLIHPSIHPRTPSTLHLRSPSELPQPPTPPSQPTFLLRRTSCRTNGWKK